MFTEFKASGAQATSKIPTPKIIFFDIDDTLSRAGIIDKTNQATLEALADSDIKLVISTGRSKAILPPDILALLEADVLDAIICMNGQYSFDKSGRISHYPLTDQQTAKIVHLCQASNLIHKSGTQLMNKHNTLVLALTHCPDSVDGLLVDHFVEEGHVVGAVVEQVLAAEAHVVLRALHNQS